MALPCPFVATNPRDYTAMNDAEIRQQIEHELGSRERLRALFASLHDVRGWTWAQIGAASGLHLTTVRKIARGPHT